MLRHWAARGWSLGKRTYVQWQRHSSAELASSLAFFGALALAGLALAAVFVAGRWMGHGSQRSYAEGHTRHIAGANNALALDAVLRQAATRHDAWIALAAGIVIFAIAIALSALQLQHAIDTVWDVDGKREKEDGDGVRRRILQFAGIYGLTLLLAVLLFAGATVHALTYHTHHLPALRGILYQALDVGASIVVLTFIFLTIYAYLPHAGVRWREVWPAAVIGAVLYERGQFVLAIYFGQMDATSPYADAGAVIAVLIWLYYSAQVLLAGAELTRVLHDDLRERRKRDSRAA